MNARASNPPAPDRAQRPTPPPAPPPRKVAGGIVVGGLVAVHLSETCAVTLAQIAFHEQSTPSRVLDRLIAERAEAIGFPKLLSAAEGRGLPRKGADPGSVSGAGARPSDRLPASPDVSPSKADRPSPRVRRSPAGEADGTGDRRDDNP